MSDFLLFKEGYFLIRVIIKSAKCELLQKEIVTLLIDNIKNFHKCHNWSLISQCVIYNFPIKNFIYEKSCSKHVNSNDYIVENELDYDYNNKNVHKFISCLFKNINYWEEKQFLPLIECAIKISKVSFQKLLNKYFSQSEKREFLLDFFFHSWNGFDLIKLLLNTMERTTSDNFIDYFHKYFKFNKQEICRYDDWLHLLKMFTSVKDKKLSVSSKSSLSTNNTISNSNLQQQVNNNTTTQQQINYYHYPYMFNGNLSNDLNYQYYSYIMQAPTIPNIQSFPMMTVSHYNYNGMLLPNQTYISKN